MARGAPAQHPLRSLRRSLLPTLITYAITLTPCATVPIRIATGTPAPIIVPTPTPLPSLRRSPAPMVATSSLSPLADICVTTQKGSFEYVVCPFANATQRETSASNAPFYGVLGIWSGWHVDRLSSIPPSAVMLFTDGTDCGSKRRALEVTLACDKGAAALSDVAEPRTCEYTAVLACPHACDLDYANLTARALPPPTPRPTPSATVSRAVASTATATASTACDSCAALERLESLVVDMAARLARLEEGVIPRGVTPAAAPTVTPPVPAPVAVAGAADAAERR